MANKYSIAKIIALLLVGLPCWSFGQKSPGKTKSADRMLDAITYIMGDTLNPEIYIVPVRVKFANDTGASIGYDNALSLFRHLSVKYGWNKRHFIKQLWLNLSGKQVFQVKEDIYFQSLYYPVPSRECNCLFNESPESLKKRITSLDYYRPPDNRFSCFVYKCFKEGIVMAMVEGHVIYIKNWEGK